MNAIIINPPNTATASVIWLHGLGASGHDFEPVVPHFPTALTQHTRFIFPHAPERPVTINNGMVMPAWYDVVAMDLTTRQDLEGTQASEKLVHKYIDEQVNQGICHDRIVIAGFSQGGAIALYTGLRYTHKLAGVVALSTYVPFAEQLGTECHQANQSLPIFLGHGQLDPVIPHSQGEMSRNWLQQHDYDVAWHSYMMEHSVNMEEIDDIGQWLAARLP